MNLTLELKSQRWKFVYIQTQPTDIYFIHKYLYNNKMILSYIRNTNACLRYFIGIGLDFCIRRKMNSRVEDSTYWFKYKSKKQITKTHKNLFTKFPGA